MKFPIRGRREAHADADAVAAAVKLQEALAAKELAKVSAVRLSKASKTMGERLTEMLGERQAKTIALDGLLRLTLHRTPIDIGGVLIDEEPEDVLTQQVRTNFDIALGGRSLEIARHVKGQGEQRFRFVKTPGGVYLDRSGTHEALSSPLAQDGLEKLDSICERLGKIGLTKAA